MADGVTNTINPGIDTSLSTHLNTNFFETFISSSSVSTSSVSVTSSSSTASTALAASYVVGSDVVDDTVFIIVDWYSSALHNAGGSTTTSQLTIDIDSTTIYTTGHSENTSNQTVFRRDGGPLIYPYKPSTGLKSSGFTIYIRIKAQGSTGGGSGSATSTHNWSWVLLK